MNAPPAIWVTETIDHGQYHRTSLPFEVRSFDDLRFMIDQSPYYRNHSIPDGSLLQLIDDLRKHGRAEFGWSTFDVAPVR